MTDMHACLLPPSIQTDLSSPASKLHHKRAHGPLSTPNLKPGRQKPKSPSSPLPVFASTPISHNLRRNDKTLMADGGRY